MSSKNLNPTVDVVPWPDGEGFRGSSAWWEYVHSHTEREKLDFLMLAALLNDEISRMLLNHDKTLLAPFQFSEQTITLLSTIQVHDLHEFAQMLITRISHSI